MTDFNQSIDQGKDLLNLEQKDMQKLPSMLNVLTILTYIGCAFGAIGAIWGYFSVSTSYKLLEGMDTNNIGSENKAVQSIMSGSLEMVKRQYENRLIILILGLVGVALCFYGALQMRNLKKQGYIAYVIGELIPIISFAAFIGFSSLFAGIGVIFTTLFAAVFIVLYTTQRKALVN